MRKVCGLILLMIGAVWALGPLGLIWQGYRNPPFQELGVTIEGITMSPQVAGAIFLVPPALIIAYGVYLLRTLPKDRF